MAGFRRLVLVALCAGLLSGIFATAGHQISTVPVILKAEMYEKAAERQAASVQAHEHNAMWEPENGAERAAYTLIADVLTGIGFALLLAAGLTLRGGEVTCREGLFWGLAGFAAFTIAPGLGLPPQVPGAEAAPLFERQIWWLVTAVSTGGALALFSFTRRAPWAMDHSAEAPESLARQFVVAVTIVSFLFWLILGASTGYFFRRFHPRIDPGARVSP
jgi:cobalt transporter subunit CbtA